MFNISFFSSMTQEYVVMNLDSRLLSFPLYVCCNFLYTSPNSDHRPDSSEQESTAPSVSWCPAQQPLAITFPLVMLGHWHKLVCTIHQHIEIMLTLAISSACCVTQWGILGNCFVSMYWVFRHIQSWRRKYHSGQEGVGHALPSEQLHTLDLCHELSALWCRTVS